MYFIKTNTDTWINIYIAINVFHYHILFLSIKLSIPSIFVLNYSHP